MQATKQQRAIPYKLMLKTISQSSNWCFNRFRLYTADSNVMVEARRPNGTILSTQQFRTSGYTWGAAYEASFLFDFSYNTGAEEIEIYIKGVQPSMKFSQMYAYTGHAGSGVRWTEDANVTQSIVNAQVTYINMGLIKFNEDYTGAAVRGLNFVYLENNGVSEIEGADQFYGGILDLRNGNLTALTADQVIIGCDNQGRADGTLYLSGNNGRTTASDTAWNNLVSKNWNLNI